MDRLIKMFILKIVLCFSDSIRVVSIKTKNDIKIFGIKNKLIEIIPTPVDLNALKITQSEPSQLFKNFGVQDKKLLLFVGRLEAQKDLHILIKAFKLVINKYSKVMLLIVGKGKMEAKLKAQVKKLDLEGNVLFLGGINNKEIFKYYKACDLFVITSKLEGRPTVLAEAMFSGKAIVATRFTGTQDLVIDGRTGFVVDIKDYKKFANRILELLTNPILLNEFGSNAYQHILNIQKSNSIKNLVELWEKTILV